MKHRFVFSALVGLFLSSTPGLAGDWPQWLGPFRTGHATNEPPFTISGNPSPRWKRQLQGGFASPIAMGDKVLVLDGAGGKETAHLLNANSGEPLWSTPFDEAFGDEFGTGPRSTPFIDGNRVYVQSCRGEFRCLDLASGKTLWRTNFADFGATFFGSKAREGTSQRRGNNGSGVIAGDLVAVPVGSTNQGTIVAFNKVTGALAWKSGEEQTAYSSLVSARIHGTAQIIAFAADSLMGMDESSGKILWRVPLVTAAKRHAATPIVWGNKVLVNSHTFGTICFAIERNGSSWEAKELWKNSALKINLSTPVLVGDTFYSQGPSRNFVAFNAIDGKQLWSEPGFGQEYSAALAAKDQLLIVTDRGELRIIQASPEKYSELSRAQVCGSNYSFPALAGGKLFVRDHNQLLCYELGRK